MFARNVHPQLITANLGCLHVLQVVLSQCFRPGDVVRASVLSLGDARSYYLSTAENELGVVYAKSIAGKQAVAREQRGVCIGGESGRLAVHLLMFAVVLMGSSTP